MKRVGSVLMRGGFVAAIALVLFQWSRATPWMVAWEQDWILSCMKAAGGPIPYACFDCDPHGCEGKFNGWFSAWFYTLPLLTSVGLLTIGGLLFAAGAVRARRSEAEGGSA